MKKVALYGGLLALLSVGSANAAGQFPGYPLASTISGFEYIPADTGDVATMASFTGVISGTTLTATAITGNIYAGQNIQGAGVAPGTVIVSGAGATWTVNNSQTVASTAMTSGGGGVNPQTEMIQMQQLRAYALTGTSSAQYVRTTPLTVATLPTCTSALNGARSTISNGVAYSLTLAAAGAIGTAVGAGTGTVTRTVLCGSTDQVSFAWVYN